MSVTVSCKRLANVFFDNAGNRIFILCEVAYESNVRPHTKSLSIVHIGDLESTMQSIFDMASYVEGGGLNSPDRQMTPERYIKSWINAIKKPYAYNPDQTLDLVFPSYSLVKKDLLLQDIQSRGTPVTLRNHYDLIVQHHAFSIVQKTFNDQGSTNSVPLAQEGGYAPKTVKKVVYDQLSHPPVVKIRTDHESYFAFYGMDGVLTSRPEWEYNIMGEYIARLYPQELSLPGSYKSLISGFRDYLRSMNFVHSKDIHCTLIPVTDYDPNDTKRSKEKLAKEYGADFTLDTIPLDKVYYVLNGYYHFCYIPF